MNAFLIYAHFIVSTFCVVLFLQDTIYSDPDIESSPHYNVEGGGMCSLFIMASQRFFNLYVLCSF